MSKEDDKTSAIGRGWASTYSATTQGFSTSLLSYIIFYLLIYSPYLSIHLSIHLSINPSIYLPISLLISLSSSLSLYLYLFPHLSSSLFSHSLSLLISLSLPLSLPYLLTEEVESCLLTSGTSWQWLPDGTLKTITRILPAIRLDGGERRSNTKNFFNSIVAAYTGHFIPCFDRQFMNSAVHSLPSFPPTLFLFTAFYLPHLFLFFLSCLIPSFFHRMLFPPDLLASLISIVEDTIYYTIIFIL